MNKMMIVKYIQFKKCVLNLYEYNNIREGK